MNNVTKDWTFGQCISMDIHRNERSIKLKEKKKENWKRVKSVKIRKLVLKYDGKNWIVKLENWRKKKELRDNKKINEEEDKYWKKAQNGNWS